MSEAAEVIEQHVEAPVENQEPDYEGLASRDGWVPEDEFRGDKSDWVDAKTFYERGQEILPIVRAKNRKLEEEIEKLKTSTREVTSHYHEMMNRQRENHRKELEEAKKQAISEADGERVVEIDRELEKIKQEAVQQPEAHPDFQQWMADNQWYAKDAKMRRYADALAAEMRQNNSPLQGTAFMEAVTNQVKEDFPDAFENPNRKRQTVATPRTAGDKGGKKSYQNLPPEAKAACDRFVAQGLMTQEQYISDYEWE